MGYDSTMRHAGHARSADQLQARHEAECEVGNRAQLHKRGETVRLAGRRFLEEAPVANLHRLQPLSSNWGDRFGTVLPWYNLAYKKSKNEEEKRRPWDFLHRASPQKVRSLGYLWRVCSTADTPAHSKRTCCVRSAHAFAMPLSSFAHSAHAIFTCDSQANVIPIPPR